jgi:hypothetical protein
MKHEKVHYAMYYMSRAAVVIHDSKTHAACLADPGKRVRGHTPD